ncbi:MAG: protein kinase [Acidobacteriota bacterium]
MRGWTAITNETQAFLFPATGLGYNPRPMKCSACQKEIPSHVSACPACGFSFDDATQRMKTPPRSTEKRSFTSFESIDDARFVPGTMLAERYRIVGLLGRGGMGEVYRADDLKLGQPVALKFLPDRFLTDGAALARFHREVRVARQVSHRNVCRVYDIGEIDGRHFLSMEFIKGEELSSLLRRIGRLPQDKAVQIARQICAGLAAAHEVGILHRDLKPSNVMIDEHGNARITDFGLAGLAEEFHDDEAHAGTPAYMAPEQLDGQTLTVRTDIYSLGLVLYEVFTGRKAFEAASLSELIKLRRSDTSPTTPTSLVKDLDPAIEKVIDRCLQKDPEQRPLSALQVAAALPGGDPLAAALAAGETPSPEMVAAAPREGALQPRTAIACLSAVVLALLFLVTFSSRTKVDQNVPLEKPPEVLAERARDIVKSLGYSTRPVDETYGFDVNVAFNQYAQQLARAGVQWQLIKTGQPLAIYLWFRQSPRYLVPHGSASVSASDPPLDVSGMTNIALDVRGRLVRFDHLPPQVEESGSPVISPDLNAQAARTTTDWSPLFTAAGLNSTSFKTAPPKWVPAMFADERVAWEGPHPDHPEIPIRIEAAAYKNKAVHFEIIAPWDKPLRQQEENLPSAARTAGILIVALFFGVLVGAAFLGRRNLRLGRSDKKGAFKLALFMFLVSVAGALLGAHHVPAPGGELQLILTLTALSLFPAAFTWLIYIALEPHLRRRSPRLIISWSRLMAGGFRDPMVGSDLLIGGLLGLAHTGAIYFGLLLSGWFGAVPPPANSTHPSTLEGMRPLLADMLGTIVVQVVFFSLAVLFLLLLLQIILRRDKLAAGAMWIVVFGLEMLAFASSGPRLYWVVPVLIATLSVISVARFGLLATIAFNLFFNLSFFYPLTSNISVWYTSAAFLPVVIMIALAIYGFYTSLAGQTVFKGGLLRE